MRNRLRSARAGCLALLLITMTWPATASEGVVFSKTSRGDSELLRLTLSPELGASWQEINVGRVVVRTGGGQRQLEAARLGRSPQLEVAAPAAGCFMIQVEVGPPTARGAIDAWRRTTHCLKILDCRTAPDGSAVSAAEIETALEARHRASSLATAKVGSRIEIRPLLNPTLLRPGSALPLRLYFDGSASRGAVVEALGPGGERLAAETDAVGITSLELPVAGLWTLRYRDTDGGEDYLAELIFEVAPEAFWTLAGGVR